jgi:hypothetical protein
MIQKKKSSYKENDIDDVIGSADALAQLHNILDIFPKNLEIKSLDLLPKMTRNETSFSRF